MGYTADEHELRERLHWLIRLRWLGIGGVFVVTHIVREVAFLTFPLVPVYAILGFAALYNLFFDWSLKTRRYSPRNLAVAQIFSDQITLAFVVYFSGGCDSPFIYFFIFHIVISGITLPWRYTVFFSVMAVVFPAGVMGLKHLGILPHYGVFSNEPVFFTDTTVIASYGMAFVATVFLTAYFTTYLGRRLYEKNEEVRRLYALSERLRSSIRLGEVVSIIERELCGFAGVGRSSFLTLDKTRRTLVFKTPDQEITVPLVDKNSFTEALLKGAVMSIEHRTVDSEYEKKVLGLMGTQRLLILPVMAASVNTCYEYFQCKDTECAAHGTESNRCWQLSDTHCRGKTFRNFVEKLDTCLSCDLFTPIGLYALSIAKDYTPLEKLDTNACMRLLDAAGLAVSNALLYEKTLGLSKIDGLTGLKNHREFKDLYDQEFLRVKRYGHPYALAMIDIDDFKVYNDTHGHPQGDILIKQVADLIRENLKDTDIVARYGGEEFVILLPETTKVTAAEIADRLRHMIDWYKFPKEDSQPGGKLTVSIGVSGYPEDGETAEEILDAADEALYRAKRDGKNRVAAAA